MVHWIFPARCAERVQRKRAFREDGDQTRQEGGALHRESLLGPPRVQRGSSSRPCTTTDAGEEGNANLKTRCMETIMRHSGSHGALRPLRLTSRLRCFPTLRKGFFESLNISYNHTSHNNFFLKSVFVMRLSNVFLKRV